LCSSILVPAAGDDGKPLWQPYYVSPRAGAQHLSLDGPWELSSRDVPISQPEDLEQQGDWIRADVPSSVQWALFRAGKGMWKRTVTKSSSTAHRNIISNLGAYAN